MSVTPGKAGELVKCYLLNSRTGIPVGQSAPAVVMERLVDVISVVILGLTGVATLSVPLVVMLVTVIALVAAALVFVVSRHALVLTRLPVVSRWSELLQDSQEGFKRLVTTRAMICGVAIGVAAWSAEGLALWVILKGIGSDTMVFQALHIYAVATLMGAATAIPGGLIGTEGSMFALLYQSGVAKSTASASTVLVRFVTLWLAVAIGLLALLVLRQISMHARAVTNES